MADPVIDNAVRAQVVFPGASGLPEDRFVNSWAFKRRAGGVGTPTEEAYRDEVFTRLKEFYAEPVVPTHGGQAQRVMDFLSTHVLNGAECRLYSLFQPPPREVDIRPMEFTIPTGTADLPREVAVVASFYSERNLPRRRGRIYLGPLRASVCQMVNNVPVVNPEMLGTVTAAMKRLASEGVGDLMDWGVLSPTDGDIKGVTHGWVDNDFDTQKRRGIKANARVTWAA